MKINSLRKKVSKIVDDLYASIEKLTDLADEFDDEEFSEIVEDVAAALGDVLSEDNSPTADMLNWLEEYEEFKEDEIDD